LQKPLSLYYINYKPAYWLFEKRSGGKYSATSVLVHHKNTIS